MQQKEEKVEIVEIQPEVISSFPDIPKSEDFELTPIGDTRNMKIKLFTGVYKKQPTKNYFIKKIRRKFDYLQNIESYRREIEIHKKANHRNILTLHAVYLEDLPESNQKNKIQVNGLENDEKFYCMVYEDFTDSLPSLLEESQNNIEICTDLKIKKRRLKIFLQIAMAIKYLHTNMEKKVIYRNFDLSDIKYDKRTKTVKISNFSKSDYAENRSTLQCEYEFVAPEISNNQVYDEKADIWSLGVLLFYLLTNKYPMVDLQKDIQIADCIYLAYELDQDERNFISNLLVIEPKGRYTIDQICEHKLLKNYYKEEKK